MNKKDRKDALSKIIKQAKLDKTAQEAIEGAEIISNDSKEFADKIFKSLLNTLEIEGLDD